MPDHDFAIHGSGLLPTLLAGFLARTHGRKVVRVTRQRSSQRLPRRIDLSLPLSARPSAWPLLRRGEGQIGALLAELGAPATTVEAALLGGSADWAAALDHLAHLALAFGHQVRQVPDGWSFRRVPQLDAEALDAPLAAWLAQCGVPVIESGASATLTVLASDDAIFDGLSEEQRPAPLQPASMTASLLVLPRPLAQPVRRYLDRGVTLVRREGSTALGIVSGDTDLDARLASALDGPFPIKRLATTRFRRFITTDGAPIIGRLKRTKTFIAAGMGDAGAFFAPALARLLAGEPEPTDTAFFAPFDPSRPRDAIADLREVAP